MAQLRPIPTILLAEDQLTNRLLIEGMLDGFALTLIQAEDGAQAVRCFQKGSIDLILMDVQMPVMSGYEAIRAIRALEISHNQGRTPTIALTANVMPSDREKCLEAGMDAYIPKPIEMDVLLNTIKQFVDLQPS